jgi:RND family efflux transporter MFP subunit
MPPLAGRLVAPPGKALPTIGERVEAAQVLGYVQPPFSDFAVRMVEAEAEAIRAKLVSDQAELVLERMKKLAAASAKSARELQDAEFTLQKSRADLEAALRIKAAYEKAGAVLCPLGEKGSDVPAVELKSPITGIITQAPAALGEHVPTDRSLFTILNTGKVLIEAKIPESEIGRLGSTFGAAYERPDAKGTFISVLGDGAGRVVFLAPEVDPSTRTAALVYEVNNPEGLLRIGMSLNLYVETTSVEDALALPVSALVDEDGRATAYVQVSGETFQKRDLAVGIRDGDFVQVLSGVSEGEHVVTKAAYAIRLSSVSSSIPAHGHAH